ncbi:two-component sensor histidine kinase [Terrabacter tumescens]|uniref:Two-component sensor histidine kinase n=1 Tax=Terrabacter tumescens TaxID=60443 RepID=A0ABQ2HYJ8_9MICO|nr:sensor histidine kinase [Terrabacter tumescens]GGM94557.1 two-component sensor histidine kinase [Terrabacter tumescens]
MSSHSSALSGSTVASGRLERMPIPTALRWGVHLLVAALLVLTALRAVVGRTSGWPLVVLFAGLVAIVYSVGPRWAAVSRSPRAARAWLALLLTAWLALLAVSPEAVYLAFPWFFLLLHLLPRRGGLTAVAVVTVAAVAGFAWHQRTLTAAMVIGPVLGAGVVTATVFGYQALYAESERRRRLILELDRTRSDLAAVQHRAGVMDERERLAREIHDTLTQGLSSIQLLLRAATRSLDSEREVNPARALDLVEQARHEAHQNLAEARRFVRALAPGDLEESTLTGALRRLCETTTSRSGIPVSFHEVGPPVLLTTPAEVALLRIAQTALANTTQHAKPTRADVTFTVMDAAVTLDIVDNGIGFALRSEASAGPGAVAVAGSRGFGLRSMASRAAELGGVLTVESQPGRGTAVSVLFDRAAASRAAEADAADVGSGGAT